MMHKKDPVLFVFDFDGVIADSITGLHEIYMDFLKGFGIKGNADEFNRLNGPNISEIVFILKKEYGIQKGTRELSRIYGDKLSLAYEKIRLHDGIEATLNLLRENHIKIALASSSKKKQIDAVLKRFNLVHFFDFIITGDEVKKTKPSPEIYHSVKAQYPDHAYYVVEDSENGLKAALGAGMKTIHFAPNNETTAQNIDYTIKSFHQIQNIITEIHLNCFIICKSDKIILKIIEQRPALGLPELDSSQKKIVEEIWQTESQEKKLFDGKIVSYHSHKKKGDTLTITCFICQYKYFIAQLKHPELWFGIAPIGVSGLILDDDDNTLIAKRNGVTEYDGFYEFIPSGSIDGANTQHGKIVFQDQLIIEFEEETNISKEKIKQIKPFCLIFDKLHGVYDICSKIEINTNLHTLVKATQGKEYKNKKIATLKEFREKAFPNNCVPTSIILLNNLE